MRLVIVIERTLKGGTFFPQSVLSRGRSHLVPRGISGRIFETFVARRLLKSLRQMEKKTIWTIGHSTRSLEEFVALLHSFDIKTLVDIRNYPRSRRYPHFNKEALEVSLPTHKINYLHLKDLGGRRRPVPNSENTAWRNEAFRGYADYMETNTFSKAIESLEAIAKKERIAYMCSEAVWWSCHRALVSDYLKSKGWTVMHIMDISKATEHPYTKPATLVDGILSYHQPGLFG